MADQMLSMYETELVANVADSDPFSALPTRAQSLNALEQGGVFDLVVLGGGLLGAAVAHEAALRGVKVLLLERDFFGSAALSWDVRIAHLLRTRPRELFRAHKTIAMLKGSRAPHLVSPRVSDSHPVKGWVAGLAQRWLPLANVDEELLIRETILAARQEGGIALSAIEPVYLEAESHSACYVVGFKDMLTGTVYTARVGGVVLDPTHGRLPASRLGTPVVSVKEPEQAGLQRLFHVLPKSAKSGFQFASFELTDGSFVAVARRGLEAAEVTVLFGSRVLPAEVVEAVAQEALHESGWVAQSKLCERPLAGCWERRYGVTQHKGVFTCTHRGPWDAYRSAVTIMKAVLACAEGARPVKRLSTRLLPGGDQACELDAFRATARAQGISERTIELCISRWRGRVRYIPEFANGLREFVPGVLRGEVDLAVASDHPVVATDLIEGSLRLRIAPGSDQHVTTLTERFEAVSSARALMA